MKAAIQNPPPGFDDLAIDEQIEYVQALWDRIAARQDQVPVPDWHREEIERRVAAFDADPKAGRSWDEVEDTIRAKHRPKP